MEVYGELLMFVVDFMKTEFELFGFTVSYWQLFLMECIAGLVCLIMDNITN